ncbi:SusC/RagA family TonB-linked outer membrane protein [Pontimicrobium sp. SW4]|uniref:SusC/RagA family TonB-linked outer membrane protein n=1 Tax=Pontimicrobium sp. SW4 TaxID=3153519 RepID=A0AAU7BRL3_9FLAO
MMVKNYFIMSLLLLFSIASTAQVKKISGTVSDESGTPLPGVNIVVKGTTNGTQTDFDGNYTINANTGDVLAFTYLGLKSSEQTVGSSLTINVTMKEDAAQLDEVVVTGVAGATSRKKLSVTVAKVSSDDLENIPTTSAASALQGKIPGVTVTNFGRPGQGSTILLRGSTNLFGSQSPLILVDGIIVQGGLQDINIDDIESFEVVKGASASALYGSRAGNGVIVITTKKGKSGKVNVSLKSEIGFSEFNRRVELSKSHNFDLASDWEDFKGVYTKYDGVTYPSDYNGSNYANVTGGRIPSADGYTDNPYGKYYDNQDLFFRTGVNQTLYASLATASENSNIYFSGENVKQEGVYRDTEGYERISARLNADFRINEWLKFSGKSNFIKTVDKTPGGGSLFALTLAEPDVNLSAPNPDGQPYLYVPNLWASNVTNPLYGLYDAKPIALGNTFLGSYSFNIKPSNWLNFDVEYTLEATNSRFESFFGTNSLTTGGPKSNYYSQYFTGQLTKTSSYTLSQKTQFTANFQHSLENLNIKGKLSYLMEDYHSEWFRGVGNNLIYQGVVSLDNFDSANTRTSSRYSDQRAQNAFAIIGLDYKDKLILDAMYRIDGSSLFGSEQRWNPYYRVSGAYRISQDFENDNVQELKLRAAYGTAGQRPGFSWQYDRITLLEGQLSTNRTQANPNLLPSETTEFEVGLSGRFFDRFDIDAIYSKSKTEDQFMLVDIFAPANNGQNKKWDNIGTIDFETIEVNLGVDILKGGPFKWNTNFAFSTTKNEITKLDVDPIKVGPSNAFYIKEGTEFGTMFGRKFVSSLDQMSNQLPSGRTLDEYSVNSDGVVVETASIGTTSEKAIILLNDDGSEAYKEIGTQTPDFTLGITSNMSYKDFSLYMLWDIKKGGDIYNQNGQWLTRDNRHAMVDQAGKPAAQKKTYDYYQSLYDVNQVNGFWVEDASFTKLREASLFYTFSKDKLSGVANGFFDSLRIGLTGNNLLTLTDYSGFDPEVQTLDNNTQQYFAVDNQSYPVFSTYTFSVLLKF